MAVTEEHPLLAAARARRTNRTPNILETQPEPVTHEDDLVPDVEPYERSEDDDQIDAVIDNLDIVDAYRLWCGKMEPQVGSKTKNIMISCPVPGHVDSDPSASIDREKQVWVDHGTCYPLGGDKYDLAAIHFGYAWPHTYKTDGTFPALRRQMAESLGYVIRRTLTGKEYLEEVEPAEPAPLAPLALVPTQDSIAPTIPITAAFDSDLNDAREFDKRLEEARVFIDWENLLQPDTFWREWMEATTIDDLPHEYYFMLAAQAIGFACGTDTLLADFQPIKANINLCQYGNTASGKTRSVSPYEKMLREFLPWKGDAYTPSNGVEIIGSTGSAESLLKHFQHEILDPSTQQRITLAQVRGLIKVEEFAAFISRASRPTNPMKETLIELYDILNSTMTHTSISGGKMQAENPFAQMLTGTQPRAIHSYLRKVDTESGFMNRWIFAAGTRRRSRISYGGTQIDYAKPGEMLKDLRTWCHNSGQGRLFVLDGAPLEVWDEFFQRVISPLHDNSDEPMLSRIDLHLKKFIVMFTVNAMEPQPTVETVQQAISLYDYLKATSLLVAKDINFSDSVAIQELVMKAIRSRPDGATRRNILDKLNGKYELEVVVRVIKTLTELGEIEEFLKKGKGPSTSRYKVAG